MSVIMMNKRGGAIGLMEKEPGLRPAWRRGIGSQGEEVGEGMGTPLWASFRSGRSSTAGYRGDQPQGEISVGSRVLFVWQALTNATRFVLSQCHYRVLPMSSAAIS